MLALSSKWARELAGKPETGMGYQVVSVILKNGRRFDRALVVGGYITKIKDIEGVPFTDEQIDTIVVTHDKWDFDADR
jgi:hypothetical protein